MKPNCQRGVTLPKGGMPKTPDSPENARTGWRSWSRLAFLPPFFNALSSWAFLACVVGFLPGIGAWLWSRRALGPSFEFKDEKAHIIRIKLTLSDQRTALLWGVSTLVVLLLVFAVLAYRKRIRDGQWPSPTTLNRWNFCCLPLAFAPLIVALGMPRIELQFQVLTLLMIAIVSVGMGLWFATVTSRYRPGPDTWVAFLEKRRAPEILTALMMGTYIYFISRFAILEHHSFDTHVFDLGIYDNTFWNSAHGNWMKCTFVRGGTHLSAHFDPIIIVLSPIYRLYPRAETILVLQTVWLASSGIPLYLHARRTLRSPWLAAACVLVFYATPALHGVNLFDFHSLALMIPLAMWLVYAIDANKPVLYGCVLPLFLLVREDMPLVASMIALYAILMKRPRWGVITILLSVAYLFALKKITIYVLGDAGKTHDYQYYYEELIHNNASGVFGLVLSSLSDPAAALAVLSKPEKLFYFIKVFGPLLGIPFLAGRKVWLYAYGFAFIGLASRKYVFTLHYQYSTFLLPFIYMGYVDGLRRLTSSRMWRALSVDRFVLRRALMFTSVVATLGLSAKYGALMKNDSFRGGWNVLHREFNERDADRMKDFLSFKELIPDDVAVCAPTVVAPHLSNRPKAYRYPHCGSSTYFLLDSNPRRKEDKENLKRYKDQKYEVLKESNRMILLRKPQRR